MKRIIYTLACLLLSVGAWAENVAKIGTQEYATLAEAVAAVPTDGLTIALMSDVDLATNGLTIDRTLTIDLNGHNLKVSESKATNIQVESGATLTLKDTSAGGAGKVYTEDPYASGHANGVIHVFGQFVLESGHIEAVMTDAANKGQFGVVMDANGKVTVNGGEIKAGWYAISGNGNNSGNYVEVNGGTLISTADYAIYSPAKNSTVTVNDGTVYGQAGAIAMNAGTLSVTGGTITSKGQGSTGTWGDGTGGLNNAAININAKYGDAKAEIKGGKIIAEGNAVTLTTSTKYNGTIEVSGGTFSSAVPEEYCVAGFVPQANDDGTYGVKEISYVAQVGENKYESLTEAISAAQNGETVKLLADATANAMIEISGKGITLDLNGKTISPVDGTKISGGLIGVHNGAGLTIDDSSAEKTGKITSGNSGNVYAAVQVTVKGDAATEPAKLIVNNGNLEGYYYAISGNGARHNTEITINGGTFKGLANSPNTDDMGLGIFHPQDGKLTINGGEFEGPAAGVEIRAGELNVLGGSFKATATEFKEAWNGSGTTVVGAAIAISQHSTNKDIKVNITGGTFEGIKAVYEVDLNTATGDKSDNININIEGGSFKGVVASENVLNFISGGTFNKAVPEEYCAVGFIPEDNGDGTYGVKEKDYVAQIGDVKYESLADAIAAAQNDETVTLLSDVTENITIPAGKNITLDLGGKTLNGKQTASTPTIKNQGTLTLTNGNVRRSGDGSASWYIVENEGTITMDEGLNVEGSASSSLIRNNAATAQMTFNAGTYIQTGAFIVVKNDLGNVVINGGTFSTASDKNVLNNWDQMTINGGTFTGNIFNGAYDKDNNKLTINDGTFNTSQIRTYLGNDQTTCPIEIKGGNFKNDQMKYVGTGNNESDTDVQVAVSGGTFANPVPEKYCAEDFIPKDNGDGTYGVKEGAYIARIGEQGYETLDAAIEAAKQEESATTITLLDNAETTKETLPANVTIDANNKVLTMPSFVVLDGEAYTLPNITGAETYKVKKATYIRTNISATKWGTVCLPFSLTSGNGADYYTYNNISGSTLTVDEASAVEPNTPVMFQKAAGDLEINEANATVSLVTPETLVNGALVGTYTDANITAKGNIYFINGNTFHKAQVSVKVPMYRAYINYLASGAKPDVLNLNVIGIGNADGIESVVMDATNTAEAIYDVNGRQLTAPQKGLNIMKLANGKTVKVAVK